MKLKSYSLLEILIAATIFMTVTIVAATSFAATRKNNARTDEQMSAELCARETEDYLSAQVRQAVKGNRIVGIVQNDNIYTLKDLKSTLANTRLVDHPSKNFSGLLFVVDDKKYLAVYKVIDGEDSFYRAKSGNYSKESDIADGKIIGLDSTRDNLVHAKECGFFTNPMPFKVITSLNASAASFNDLNNNVIVDPLELVNIKGPDLTYLVGLDDNVYREFDSNGLKIMDQIQSKDSQDFIRVNINAQNSAKQI